MISLPNPPGARVGVAGVSWRFAMPRFLDLSPKDRRISTRHAVKTPLKVRLWKSSTPEHAGQSENISEQGMFFATDLRMGIGSVIELVLKMPEAITGEPEAEWRCTGHVVRVSQVDTEVGTQGVGVQFDCYQVAKS
jgi:Tfp pilus assembly protein PilZ